MARKLSLFSLVAVLVLSLGAQVSPPQYEALKGEGERYYAEGSFARALEAYRQAAKLELPDFERRWVAMRVAAATIRADRGDTSEARKQLDAIAADRNHDRIRAEGNEALGDWHFDANRRDFHGALRYYTSALDYWAGSDEIELARGRYLRIVWKLAEEEYMAYSIPREILVNALTIAKTPADRAHARYLIATQLMREGRPESIERAAEHLEAIIELGPGEWYDDALFNAAQLLAERGHVQVMSSRGEVEYSADYGRALDYLRRIVRELRPSQSPYVEQAQEAIEEITRPDVDASVTGTFVPGSEQQFFLSWRNADKVDLAIYALDLTADVNFKPEREWVDAIDLTGKTALRRWTFDTPDIGPYRPGSETVRVQPKLEPGAYLLTANAPQTSARQLLLVTEAHILTHTAGKRMEVFVSNVLTGEPIANAKVTVWQQLNRDVNRRTGVTGADGLARFDSTGDANGATFITAAAGASRQAWLSTYRYTGGQRDRQWWRIYAFTDRPAYRPNESVQWKMIARMRDGGRWVTPADQTLTYEILNPRGEKVHEGKATLNAFGSFWGELPLTSSMVLGSYSLSIKAPGSSVNAGHAELFRLEEYKLPEFEVRVATPEGKQYRTGETIEAQIEASYYFGGPVANATVEAVIHERPFVRYWYPWREYSWYFPEPPEYHGQNVLRQETLTTDANGRATLRIETSKDRGDMTYRIEARVVDASRREVRGEGMVRVTRQRYSVYLSPEHHLHRPNAQVSVAIKAVDANDRPVKVTGKVTVVRRTRQGDDEVMTAGVTTDAEGKATFTFTPKREGFYTIRWRSEDRTGTTGAPRPSEIVSAETGIWVADQRTTELGWPGTGTLDLVIDKESFRAGETVQAILVTPATGRWVVVSAAGDEIFDTQVVRLDGTVKLLEFATDERHSPNFYITASSVFDRVLAVDSERVVVPPVAHFLDVEVTGDRENYRPREEGQITITTRDADGKPVSAEVALSVSDEAVTAIQQDPAGDPRQFFFGEVRGNVLQVAASVQSQRYVKLIERNGRVVDEDAPEEKEEELQGSAYAKDGRMRVEAADLAVVGESVAFATVMPAPPPPAAAPVAPQSVTATAAAKLGDAAGQAGGGVQIDVRSDFRSTAFWKPDVVTNESGTATVTVKFPEALTTWRATARAVSREMQVGMNSDTAKTNLPLIVRLQAPRFFVAGDRTTVSAVINNNTDAAVRVTPSIEVKGLTLRDASHAPVDVPANGEARADWVVSADAAGQATLRVTGRGAAHGDAMEKTFTVYEHGIDKLVARSGKLRADEALVRLDLPRERRATELVVHATPTLATTMIEALPYLLEFPYGCVEQTMSRFLPAAVVAKTGLATGIRNLDEITRAGMARLYDMQHPNGAWGWWKESPDDDFMTAYVVWGFSIARDADLPVRTEAVNRAAEYLRTRLVHYERQHEDATWILHALSAWRKTASAEERKAFDRVWTNRERLSSYSKALLALTAHRYGDAERAKVLVRNLENGVTIDEKPDQSVLIRGGGPAAETMATAHWGNSRSFWWRWHEGPIESTAFALQALVTIEPGHKLIEPAMNWLVKNRRGAQWTNTRDTAIAVLALNDYLRVSGELRPDVTFEVSVNGKVLGTGTDAKKFAVDPSLLRDTTQEIRIRRTAGKGAVYFAAEARFVSLEEPVTAAGNELFVKREYFRLVARPTLLKGVLYDKVPLRDNESVESGERVEVVVTVETKNDYRYLVFEDLKPAGLEAVALQSGQALWATSKKNGQTAFIYQELRDRKVALFADRLDQGLWEIRYTLRAEVPGTFHALPVVGWAMYVPDVRGNGDEIRLTVTDEPPAASDRPRPAAAP